MKMTDMFKLPCKLKFGETLIFTKKTAPYAQHAVNNHDALVEALSLVIDGYSAHDLVGYTGLTEEECQTKIIDVLVSAEGES